MCKQCLREAFPERQRTTLDTGAYHLNFAGCSQCHQRGDFLKETNRRTEETEHNDEGLDAEEDDPDFMLLQFEETIEYSHSCPSCNHIVAEHFYEFKLLKQNRSTVQEFTMSCSLCGKGQDTCLAVPLSKSSTVPQQLTSNGTEEEGHIPQKAFASMMLSEDGLFSAKLKQPSTSQDGHEDEWQD